MRRAGHARLRRALGGSVPDRFPMRLVEIDRLIAVHGRARAGCPPQRGGLHFPLSRKSQIPKCSVTAHGHARSQVSPTTVTVSCCVSIKYLSFLGPALGHRHYLRLQGHRSCAGIQNHAAPAAFFYTRYPIPSSYSICYRVSCERAGRSRAHASPLIMCRVCSHATHQMRMHFLHGSLLRHVGPMPPNTELPHATRPLVRGAKRVRSICRVSRGGASVAYIRGYT